MNRYMKRLAIFLMLGLLSGCAGGSGSGRVGVVYRHGYGPSPWWGYRDYYIDRRPIIIPPDVELPIEPPETVPTPELPIEPPETGPTPELPIEPSLPEMPDIGMPEGGDFGGDLGFD